MSNKQCISFQGALIPFSVFIMSFDCTNSYAFEFSKALHTYLEVVLQMKINSLIWQDQRKQIVTKKQSIHESFEKDL